MAHMVEFFSDRAENIMRMGENAGCQQFFFLPTIFSKGVYPSVVKTPDVLVKD